MIETLYQVNDLAEAVKYNDRLMKENKELYKEIERLKNIIKEAREYITYARTPRTIYESGYGKGTCVEICMEHLLEILDKENK